jgi:hypothetical protein
MPSHVVCIDLFRCEQRQFPGTAHLYTMVRTSTVSRLFEENEQKWFSFLPILRKLLHKLLHPVLPPRVHFQAYLECARYFSHHLGAMPSRSPGSLHSRVGRSM